MNLQTLDDIPGEWRDSGDQLQFRDCPFERHRRPWSFGVDPGSGLYHCFNCGAAGRLKVGLDPRRLLARLRPAREEWGSAAMPAFEYLSYGAVRFMFEKYKLSLEMVKPYQLVEGQLDSGYDYRILIPYMDRSGEVVYYSGRSYTGDEPKYRNMPGRHPLYVPAFVAGEFTGVDNLILVEGAFDAIKVHAAGFNGVVALGGKQLARYLLHDILRMRPARVRVMLDHDALAASLRLSRQLAPFVDETQIVMLPPGEDPGSMSFEAIREALR